MVPKSVDELREIESQVESVVEKVTPAIVGLQIGQSRGTGVIVSGDGLVLTAAHVVDKPGTAVVVTTPDKKRFAGISLGTFSSLDAGMLKITTKSKDLPHVELGDSEQIKPGMWCIAMGHPLGYKPDRTPVVRIGRVLLNQPQVLQTDCPLISGDSGGPLFDLDGKLIGINSRIGMELSMNFHIPIKVFQDNWDRLKKGENFKTDLPLRNVKEIAGSFEPVIQKMAECVVEIRTDNKEKILGTIVGPDGWILTKASELKGRIICRLQDGRDLEAKVVGIDNNFDLAMLKVDALDLPVISWQANDPKVGQWVAVPGMDKKPIVFGVVGTKRHAIPPVPGFLGIEIDITAKDKVLIKRILPKSPAEKAGLKGGDQITHIDGEEAKKQLDAIKLIKRKRPGQELAITVKRGDETLELTATLSKVVTDATKKRDMLNAADIGLSERREGFPVVIQHDGLLPPDKCGSPLVDLDGKVVGVNIARAGRTETHFVPSSVLFPLMYNLMSGRAHPRLKEKADEEKDEPKKAEPTPEPKPEPKKAEPTPEPTPEPKKAEPTPEPKPEPKKAEPTPEPTPEPKKAEPTPEPTPEPKKAEPTPEPTPEPKKAEPTPEPKPEPKKAEPTPEPTPEPKKAEPTPEPTPEPKKAEPTPEPKPEPKKAEPTPEPTPEPKKAEPTPEPTPEPQKTEPKPEEKKAA